MAIIFNYTDNAAEPSSVCVSVGFWDKEPETRNRLIKECLSGLGLSLNSYTYESEEGGKPYVTAGGRKIPVSVSHSGELIMVAVSSKKVIGLDIESRNRNVSSGLLKRIAATEYERGMNAVRLWTLKESFLKMTGTGLRVAMNKIRIEAAGQHAFWAECLVTNNRAQITSFLYRDYRVALAVSG